MGIALGSTNDGLTTGSAVDDIGEGSGGEGGSDVSGVGVGVGRTEESSRDGVSETITSLDEALVDAAGRASVEGVSKEDSWTEVPIKEDSRMEITAKEDSGAEVTTKEDTWTEDSIEDSGTAEDVIELSSIGVAEEIEILDRTLCLRINAESAAEAIG